MKERERDCPPAVTLSLTIACLAQWLSGLTNGKANMLVICLITSIFSYTAMSKTQETQ